ncbi:immunoglobulin-like domain-containing protein [Thalassomonas sp. RHCl1]|uniref:immunoglobulin-like domain-containing protein n=1 Tax=Thalassomonas sp. RHCl1 TaxID=2995320 RepID=UPI00248AE78C|nr:immunoglobulin-like domain-containing protein [Thalassomonas sp. RHCl1]
MKNYGLSLPISKLLIGKLFIAFLMAGNAALAGELNIADGGKLTGSGTVSGGIVNLQSGGVIAPGNSPGCMLAGDLSLNSGGSLDIEIEGTSVCTEYDQLDITGSVSLGSAALTIDAGNYSPNIGDTFTLINNDGADTISGTFDSLPEGVEIDQSSYVFSISYQGGDGNDVTLATLFKQSIDFSVIADQEYGDSLTLSATASSGLAVSYSSNTHSICTVNGSTVSLINVGTCSILASQSGDANYLEADDLTQSFTVNKASQTITFAALADKNSGDVDFDLAASSSSGLTVSFVSSTSSVCSVSGTRVSLSDVGTCSITASQSGDTHYSAAADVSRSFSVLDATAPVIVLNGDGAITIAQGSSYSDAGASASDNVDGDISSSIVSIESVDTSKVGSYTVTFNVTDTAGNAAVEVTRTVTVTDQTVPVISLIGDSSITIAQDSTYSDAGASASDNNDGDISANIVMSGSVNTNSIGTYTLSYDVSDAANNAAITVNRTVEVTGTDTDGDGIGDNADTDDDNDGVDDSDDAFPLDASEDTDTDGDGIGDNADSDDDNDGVDDLNDAFPNDPSETTDTDGDGVGNNADTDDDGDGILDEDDNEPLIANTNDNQAPVIADIENVEFEATGVLTLVSLIAPAVSDDRDTSPSISSNITGGLSLGEHVVIWTATDFAGNQSTQEQLVTIVDTTPPEFGELARLTINAQGQISDISTEVNITAIDLVDGDISPVISGETKFVSGRHSVELSAVDNAGNSATAYLAVDILPEATIAPVVNIAVGGSNRLDAYLSGQAPSGPVKVDYQVSVNDIVIEQSTVSINTGLTGGFLVNLPADVSANDNVVVELITASNAFIGRNNQAQVHVVEKNLAPMLEVSMSQQGGQVSVIDPSKGLVTVTAKIEDVNAQDTHDINWSSSEPLLIDASNSLTYAFEPGTLDPGSYNLEVTARENNTQEALSVTQIVQVVVENLPGLSSALDSDHDGIVDEEEGYGDSDGDGIADYLDSDSNISRLPIGSNSYSIETTPGLKMSLGSSIRALFGSGSREAIFTPDDVIELALTRGSDASDNHFEAISPLYNFIIGDLLIHGDSVAVIIPLEQGALLPEGAVYRKYNMRDGWFNFVEDTRNSVSSALADVNGNCPAAYDASYTLGLSVGDNCIQLIIEDGGPNDADFIVNGSVEDPGTLAIGQPNQAPAIDLAESYDVDEETAITLDASNTIDAEGDVLNYSWTQTSGTPVELTDTASAVLSFISPSVSKDEVLSFELSVGDGRETSIASVEVTVYQVNKAPVVTINNHAASYQEKQTITLTAQGSDPDGDIISYQWQQLSGSAVSIEDINLAQAIITLPEVASDEEIELAVTVTDGQTSTSMTTSVTVVNEAEVILVTPDKDSRGGSMAWLLALMLVVSYRKFSGLQQAA